MRTVKEIIDDYEFSMKQICSSKDILLPLLDNLILQLKNNGHLDEQEEGK